jgi:hypothetical protein
MIAKLKRHLSFATLLAVLIAIGGAVSAFAPPAQDPPGGNVAAPLNTSSTV